jgi:hypothetical protein
MKLLQRKVLVKVALSNVQCFLLTRNLISTTSGGGMKYNSILRSLAAEAVHVHGKLYLFCGIDIHQVDLHVTDSRRAMSPWYLNLPPFPSISLPELPSPPGYSEVSSYKPTDQEAQLVQTV